MRVLIPILLLAATAVSAAGELTLTVSNAPAAGTLVVQVYDSANAFGQLTDATPGFDVLSPLRNRRQPGARSRVRGAFESPRSRSGRQFVIWSNNRSACAGTMLLPS